MKTLKSIALISTIAVLLPGIALAHNGNGNDKERKNIIRANWVSTLKNHAFNGTVTATTTGSFTMKAKSGTVYTVNTTGAKILPAVGTSTGNLVFAVNDSVLVKGVLTNTTIAASTVIITPANTHRASAKGTVTAIGNNTITVQSTNHGIPSTVTVNTSANTVYTKNGTTTVAAVQVGSKIKAVGLWDEIKNTFNAFKVKVW